MMSLLKSSCCHYFNGVDVFSAISCNLKYPDMTLTEWGQLHYTTVRMPGMQQTVIVCLYLGIDCLNT